MWYTWVYYTTIYAYTQYTKDKFMQKIRPLLVFIDLRCQTSEDGRYEVPYVKIDPIAVTKDNMDEEIIDSGFHLREDVYLVTP